MTEQNISDVTDAERRLARDWAEAVKSNPSMVSAASCAAARVILNAVPEPRPTLADMTPKEQAACKGMQADLVEEDRVVILDGTPDHDGWVRVLERSLDVYHACPEDVTPRPDLPRLTWPGTEKADDEKTVKIGDVIESADDPRIAALPDGSVLLDSEGEATAKRNHSWRGAGYTPVPSQGVEFGPWAVVRIGQENE